MANSIFNISSINGGRDKGVFPAVILANCDGELRAKAERLREHKNGLMQLLLTGKKQINLNPKWK